MNVSPIIKDFARRVTSRKFIVAVGSVVTLLSTRQFVEAGVVASLYLLAQAHVDAKLAAKVVGEVAPIIEVAVPRAAPVLHGIEVVAKGVGIEGGI